MANNRVNNRHRYEYQFCPERWDAVICMVKKLTLGAKWRKEKKKQL